MNLTDSFIDYLYKFSNQSFDEDVVTQSKRCFLDYLGVTYAGKHALGTKLNLLLEQFSITEYSETEIDDNYQICSEHVAFINGLCSHFLELDDGSRFGGIHPGAPIFSSLLALIQFEDVNVTNFIKAIVTGYEAAIRLSAAIQPYHHNLGYHPTGTCGAIGAAIALSVALNFDKPKMKKAFTVAALTTSGSLKVLENASELKPINVGYAAKNAIMAIKIARVGLEIPEDVLGGKNGFVSMMANHIDQSLLLDIDTVPAIKKIYFKVYPACRHCHSPIEATIDIIKNKKFSIDDIKSIKVKTYNYVIGKHDHKEILGSASAKMSIPYCVSAAILFGAVGSKQFTLESIRNPRISDLINKVEVVEDYQLSKLVPRKRPATVEVTLKNDESYVKHVDFPRGEPENPVSNDELFEKFEELMKYTKISEEKINNLKRIIFELETTFGELKNWL